MRCRSACLMRRYTKTVVKTVVKTEVKTHLSTVFKVYGQSLRYTGSSKDSSKSGSQDTPVGVQGTRSVIGACVR